MKKRVGIVFITGMLLLAGLGGRLWYIQIFCGEALSAGAQSQYRIVVNQEEGRGTIYDRNLVKLTDCCSCYYYLIPREKVTAELEALMKKIGGEKAGTKGEDYVVFRAKYFLSSVNKTLREEYGAYGFCGSSRYSEKQIAAHLIGYISEEERRGMAGLEKMYDAQLSSSPAELYLTGSGTGQVLRGIGTQEMNLSQEISKKALITTIDAGLQQYVEQLLEEKQIKGAVVVLDSNSGQVLTMASSPSFDPGDLGKYLDSENGELVNKAASGLYAPGSVFKLVVAASALEMGIDPEETFTCTGSHKLAGLTMTCSGKPEGHGTINLKEAVAQSCNCYFAQLGGRIGGEVILEMASRMGLGKTVFLNFPAEEGGNFPSSKEYAGSGISNLSIGQGSLLVTPLQIGKMTNIIASGGIDYGLHILMQDEEETTGRRVLSAETAAKLGEMMEAVFKEGTARESNLHITAAGKTGSAEATDYGTETVHGWFTGYFPAEAPAYTVSVLVENGKTGSGSALPVFEKIANYLY